MVKIKFSSKIVRSKSSILPCPLPPRRACSPSRHVCLLCLSDVNLPDEPVEGVGLPARGPRLAPGPLQGGPLGPGPGP